MKKYLAELLGTFALALIVALSLGKAFPISTPVLAGFTLALFVYTIGHLSGAHINPAVTVGAWSIGKMKHTDAIAYLIMQFVGGALAMLLASTIFHSSNYASQIPGNVVFWSEAIGAFFFTFGVAAAMYKKVPENFAGVVVGGSLFLGICFAALLGSAGFINPAVALGSGSLTVAYFVGPLVGGIAGMWAYKYLLQGAE